MTENTLADLIPEVSQLIEATMGLNYPPERWPDLHRGLQVAGKELGHDDVGGFANWLLSAPLSRRHIEALASALTVGETFFFRDRQTFTALEHNILPPLIEARRTGTRQLRLWSAGCCTGEEPYSLAMLVARLLPDISDWSVTILATDINPRFLQKAIEGVFAEWSFRDGPAWLKDKYFTKTENGRYAVLPRIKQMVRFASLNLVEDVYPSFANNTQMMDVIFCRNVLIYLSGSQTKKVIGRFADTLTPGGWLSVSATETSPVLFNSFDTVNFPGVTLYRKQTTPAHTPECTSSPTPPTVDAAEPSVSPHSVSKSPQTQAEPRALADAPPTETDAALQMARACADKGDLQKALEWCETAIRTDKLNPMGYYLRGMILQESGFIEEAVQALKQTLYLNPEMTTAHFALGGLTHSQGRHKEAEKHLNNALHLLQSYGPEDTVPHSGGVSAGRMADIIKKIRQGNIT